VTESIFSQGRRPVSLQFAVRPGSLAAAFAIGLVISVVTVWATSLRIGRLNVIRALRDTPPPPRPVPARPSRTAAAGVLLGCVLFALSVATSEPVLALVGPALVAWSAVPLLTPTVGQRAAVTGPCLLLVIYGVTAFAVLPSVFRAADIPVFFVQGVLLVFSAVAVVVRNDDQFHRVSERLSASGRGLALRLGLANPLAKRFRTALLLGMYALIMFVLVFMAVFAAVFRAQAPTLTEQTRAGYDLRVDSNPGNPVTANQLEADADVLAAAPILLADAQFQIDPTADAQSQRLGGFDSSLLDRGAPHLTLRDARFATDEAAWRAVLASPDLAIVPGGFLSSGGGPPRRTIDLGTRLTLIDPASGRRHPITVVGIDGDLDPAENGAMVAASAIPTFVDRSSASRFYVAVRPGADAESVGQRLQGALLVNGAKVDSFRSLVESRLGRQTDFISLLEGFLALGLVIGIAGLGVVMVRAVRERRREIGMLRAMGFAALVVRRAFLIEAAFIAVQGIVVGALLGIVTGFSVLSNSSTFGDQHLAFTVPWLPILGLAAVALFASLLAVLVPARQASRIKPAVALRIAD
jgi:putative ABC transport system permease protein